MIRVLKVLLVVGIVGAVLTVFGIALAKKVDERLEKVAAGKAEAEANHKAAQVVVPPELVQAEVVPAETRIRFTGMLEPSAAVDLAFKLPGRVTEVLKKRGDPVTAGEVLARIGTRELEAQKAQAEAALRLVKAQKSVAQDAWARTKKLKDAGVGTEQQLEMAAGQHTVASAAISQAVAAIDSVKAMEPETTLHAAMDGTLVTAPTSTGFVANPMAPIFRIERLSVLKFVGQLTERDAVRIAQGTTVTVTAESGRKGKGEVTLILGSIDPITHRVPIEARIDNADGALFANAFVDAEVEARPRDGLATWLALPLTALLTGDEPAVLVVSADDKLERRNVKVAESHSGRLFLISGVTPAERVVRTPGTQWRDGDTLPKPQAAN